MHITMVKKRLLDGSVCCKCGDATKHLQSRGLWSRIDEVIWAEEGDDASPGMAISRRLGIECAPFFVVRDDGAEAVYTSVLALVRERLGGNVTAVQQACAIDADDIGGI
jgi:hypothetical protein